MHRECQRGELRGLIHAPSSKSAMQRAIACALMAEGTSQISFSSDPCADSMAALRIAETLGAKIRRQSGSLLILGSPYFTGTSKGKENPLPRYKEPMILNCGESGLCMRMFSPIASLLETQVVMRAEGSLAARPMYMMENPFMQLGVRCQTNGGLPPVRLSGPLRGGKLLMDSGDSSQFLTGLIMALPCAEEGGQVELERPVSTGYLDMTAQMCRHFGVLVSIAEDYRKYDMPGAQEYKSASIRIEGDWSAAAFLAVGAAISSSQGLRILGLDPGSYQPDKAIMRALDLSGSNSDFQNDELIVSRGKLEAFEFDATDCPDLFPPLSVLAAACGGISKIRGIHRLKNKESNRAISIQGYLAALGVRSELDEDVMKIWGGKISGGEVDSRTDHRIAMAAAIAALVASEPVIIKESECVKKSWPSFFEDLETIRY